MTKKPGVSVRLFAKKGLVNAIPLMAKALNKSEEQVIEDLVFSTEPYYLATAQHSIQCIEDRVKGSHTECEVTVSEKAYKSLKFFCEKWRGKLSELLVVCLYYSHKAPLYMKAVKTAINV